MDISSAPGFSDAARARNPTGGARFDRDANISAVAWAAVFAGAAAAAALSLVLLILGTGLGLSAVSPWAQAGATATAIGVASIAWITLTQVLASGMGGYLAGRLRTRWHGSPTDEIFFRDTAHGFLAWAVATLVTAALLTSAIGSIIGSGVRAGATVAGAAGAAGTAALAGASSLAGSATPRADASSASTAGPLNYFVDALFRVDTRAATPAPSAASPTDPATPITPTTPAPTATPVASATPAMSSLTAAPSPPSVAEPMAAAASSEVTRILMHNMRANVLPTDDLRRISQLVAQRTGLSQAESDKRVTDTYARWQATLRDAETAARATADTARKAATTTALWLFISLLIGAFVASLAATIGGRQRDA